MVTERCVRDVHLYKSTVDVACSGFRSVVHVCTFSDSSNVTAVGRRLDIDSHADTNEMDWVIYRWRGSWDLYRGYAVQLPTGVIEMKLYIQTK